MDYKWTVKPGTDNPENRQYAIKYAFSREDLRNMTKVQKLQFSVAIRLLNEFFMGKYSPVALPIYVEGVDDTFNAISSLITIKAENK